MIRENYELDGTTSKATEDMRLWQTEKGVVEISENTLATSITLGDQRRGYVFHGHGKLLIDAIVETDEGAIGKSVEKKLNEPFLMLGETEEIQKHLTKASEEDLAKMGYEKQQGFVDKAEDLCDQFFKKKGVHNINISTNTMASSSLSRMKPANWTFLSPKAPNWFTRRWT